MRKISQGIVQLWTELRTPIYKGKSEETSRRITGVAALIVACFAVVVAILNFMDGSALIGAISVALFGAAILAACACFLLKNKSISDGVMISGCVIAFSYFTVSGSNDGFSILWTLLAPVGSMYFCGILVGLYASWFYEILFIICFWTPFRSWIPGDYNAIFIQRFPLLFLCDIARSCAVMINYHRAMLKRNQYESDLNRELDELTRDLKHRMRELERMSYQTVRTLASAIDAKDRYTNGHAYRVSEYAVLIAEEMGWTYDAISKLRVEGLLHDVGKIGVPDLVLNKPGRLTDEEFRIIQSHTVMGAEVLRHADAVAGAREVAKYHHERYDGKGYPEGLAGEEIPENARIVCIADAYDAMHSSRIYRKALPDDVIRAEMERGRGTQFDPQFLDVFLKLMDEGRLEVDESLNVNKIEIE